VTAPVLFAESGKGAATVEEPEDVDSYSSSSPLLLQPMMADAKKNNVNTPITFIL
jgi:hypothetical protein